MIPKRCTVFSRIKESIRHFCKNIALFGKITGSFLRLCRRLLSSLIFRKYDIVLSDSSSYAKGVITRPETLHISYMHTPMRYAWDDCQKYTEDFGFPRLVKKLVPFFMNPIRLWDRVSADRVDRIMC
jgi:hypothetical protein